MLSLRVALYTATIFTSAMLLFMVQPLAGRALLPRLGGVPSAWTACLLFFQGALLVGYGYVWVTARWPERVRALAHVALLASCAVWLPAFARTDVALSATQAPVRYALVFLALSVGAPFVLLSTTSPLLQHWLAREGRRPYALYAASNVGSLASLLLYPFVIEPSLAQRAQASLFRGAFVGLTVMIALCAVPALRAGGRNEVPSSEGEAIGWSRRARWVFYALVPTMLLSGATTHISLELAPLPLLWVVPLALYLASFVLAFSTRVRPPPPWLSRAASLVAVVLVFAIVVHGNDPVWVLVLLNLLFLGAACWISNWRLADDAPDPSRLPEFYAWIAVGGVLGTLVTAVVAPALLPDLWEYPLAIALATAARPREGIVREDGRARDDFVYATGLFALTLALSFALRRAGLGLVSVPLTFAPSLLLTYRVMPRRRRFALALLAIIAASAFVGDTGERLLTTRSFFGVLRVVDEAGVRRLMHGTTLHGAQRLSQRDRCEPLTYYARRGPLGQFFDAERARGARGRTVAIGLGTGAVLCYAREGEPWRVLEINADVLRIAAEPRWFTYLQNAPTRDARVDLEDGRLGVASERDATLTRVIVDAFNSDSVPAHLLTREALATYLRKLAPGGRLVMHLSNRVLDLERVLAAVVHAEGAVARTSAPNEVATWAVIARHERDLADLDERAWPRLTLARAHGQRPWTDEYSSLLSAIRTRRE
jgi:spermidine synthase